MLFVAEYDFNWDVLDAVIAKRLEWDDATPDGFRFIGEYIWQDRDPPFRGVAIIEANDIEALNSFALHYGPTLKLRIHPASDVVSAMRMVAGGAAPQTNRKTKKRGKSPAARS